MLTKVCSTCKIEKELNNFNKCTRKKYGVSSVCKECHSSYRKEMYAKNRDKELNQVKDYQLKTYGPRPKRNFKNGKQNKKCEKAGRTVESVCKSCGDLIFISKNEFEKGVKKYCSKSCRQTSYQSVYARYLSQVKRRAIKLNKEYDLSEEYLKYLLEEKQENRCALTKVPIRLRHTKESSCLYNSASLDRIDNARGYTKDNVQWVVLGINYMKLDFDESEVNILLKLITQNYTDMV